MPSYYNEWGWAPYTTVAERRKQAAREAEKLRQSGKAVAPVIIAGRKIATTFWGEAWCRNLESYHDYASRLPRGRSYVRNGSVVDLAIAPLAVTALVSGSSLYEVTIDIAQLPKSRWQSVCRDCAGGIDSLVELLKGRFSKPVMERICRQDEGLFPRPSEIKFDCTCPDYASMCKHVAAVLYGVGARLDAKPELLFRLRSVDENDLLRHLDATAQLSQSAPAGEKILESDDISALFGLEMAGGDGPGNKPEHAPTRPAPAKGRKAERARGASKGTRPRRPTRTASTQKDNAGLATGPLVADGRPSNVLRPSKQSPNVDAAHNDLTRVGGEPLSPALSRKGKAS